MPICVLCKKNVARPCERENCPLKPSRFKNINIEAKKDFCGISPNIFIGNYNYPNINVGFLSSNLNLNQDDIKILKSSSIRDVLDLRTTLINAHFKSNIKSRTKLLELNQEVAQSIKPADVEIYLHKKPIFQTNFNEITKPQGPSIKLLDIKLTSNVNIPTKVDYIISQNDLKSTEALEILSKKGFDEYYLTKLLTSGSLGLKTQRKLVPTRWGITAVDDALAKSIIEKIKYLPYHEHSLFFGSLFGNYYLIMFFPNNWQYELFETFVPSGINATATDYESFNGRKEYAFNTSGGYYAARLPILQYLNVKARQASVLVFRFITEEYWAHLGCWVCREATKNSLHESLVFDSQEKILNYSRMFVKQKFNLDIFELYKKSKLLKSFEQKKLNFFV